MNNRMLLSGAAIAAASLALGPDASIRFVESLIPDGSAADVAAFFDGAKLWLATAGEKFSTTCQNVFGMRFDEFSASIAQMKKHVADYAALSRSALREVQLKASETAQEWGSALMSAVNESGQAALETGLKVMGRIVEAWGIYTGMSEITGWLRRRRARKTTQKQPAPETVMYDVPNPTLPPAGGTVNVHFNISGCSCRVPPETEEAAVRMVEELMSRGRVQSVAEPQESDRETEMSGPD